MALGAPSLSAAPSSAWQTGGTFGVQPAGPVPLTARLPRGSQFSGGGVGARLAGKAFGSVSPSGAATGTRGGGALPGAGALDYAHKLTQTTILLAALIAFVIFHRRDPRRGLRHLASRHLGEV